MSITIELPEEIAVKLKAVADRQQRSRDDIIKDGIKLAIKFASDEPDHRDPDSLERVHAILRAAHFVPPNEEEVKKIKDERMLKKYGPF